MALFLDCNRYKLQDSGLSFLFYYVIVYMHVYFMSITCKYELYFPTLLFQINGSMLGVSKRTVSNCRGLQHGR